MHVALLSDQRDCGEASNAERRFGFSVVSAEAKRCQLPLRHLCLPDKRKAAKTNQTGAEGADISQSALPAVFGGRLSAPKGEAAPWQRQTRLCAPSEGGRLQEAV